MMSGPQQQYIKACQMGKKKESASQMLSAVNAPNERILFILEYL